MKEIGIIYLFIDLFRKYYFIMLKEYVKENECSLFYGDYSFVGEIYMKYCINNFVIMMMNLLKECMLIKLNRRIRKMSIL